MQTRTNATYLGSEHARGGDQADAHDRGEGDPLYESGPSNQRVKISAKEDHTYLSVVTVRKVDSAASPRDRVDIATRWRRQQAGPQPKCSPHPPSPIAEILETERGGRQTGQGGRARLKDASLGGERVAPSSPNPSPIGRRGAIVSAQPRRSKSPLITTGAAERVGSDGSHPQSPTHSHQRVAPPVSPRLTNPRSRVGTDQVSIILPLDH
eukprot:3637873-Pleurochrysis_carterae.AAC.1